MTKEEVNKLLDEKEKRLYTVEQLIKKLKTYNPKSYVGFSNGDRNFHPFNINKKLFSSTKYLTIFKDGKTYAKNIEVVDIFLPELQYDVEYNFDFEED